MAALVIAAATVALFFDTRRRWPDALVLLAALLLAQQVGEESFGPLLLAGLACTLLLLLRRPLAAAVGAALVVGLIVLATELKLRYAGSQLTWQDLRYFFRQFGDNVGVMWTQPNLLWRAGAALALLAALLVGTWRLDTRLGPWRTPPGTPWQRRVQPLLALALAAASFAWVVDAVQQATRRPAWALAQARVHDPLSSFFATLALEPHAAFRHLPTDAFAQAARQRQGLVPAAPPADLVVFLQESQFNPAQVGGCPDDLCRRPFFDPAQGDRLQGPLRVHTFGGGTWMSEFTFQTGLPHTLFGRAGDFAPFNLAPGVSQSLVRSLRRAGYHTVAVYPVRGGMMNARAAYKAYGFDEFLDSDDLGLPGSYTTPDAALHAAALARLPQGGAPRAPWFVFVVTIFNHAEHGNRWHLLPADLRRAAERIDGSESERHSLADYLWRTAQFEQAFADSRARLLASPRPTVVAWFGDHLPPFGQALVLRDRIGAPPGVPAGTARLHAWWGLADNLGGPASAAPAQALDLAFLPGLLAERARVPLDDFLAANVEARERCQGRLVDCPLPDLADTYYSQLLDRLRVLRP